MKILNAFRLNQESIIVEFADKTTAVYTLDQLRSIQPRHIFSDGAPLPDASLNLE